MQQPADRSAWYLRLGPATAFQLAFVAAFALLKSGANAVVLSRYHAEVLPYLYLLGAGLAAGLTGLSSVQRMRGPREPVGLSLLGAAIALGLVAALKAGVDLAAIGLYLFSESFATYASIAFWATLSRAYDAREARRAFTFVSGFGMGGGIVGGVLAQELARRTGTGSVLIAGGAMLLVCAFVFRFHRPTAEPVAFAQRRTDGEVWSYVRTRGYPQALIALVFGFSVLSVLADYLFRQRAAAALSEDELSALFGSLQLWVGLFSVVFQLFFAKQLLDRLGIIRYVALVPALFAPLGALAIFQPALWPAYLLKLLETAISLSILPVAMQLLYAPVPDGVRDRFRSAMDGLVRKGGIALGGVLLLGAGAWAGSPLLGLGIVLSCMTAALAIVRLRPLYVATLQEQIAGQPFAAEHAGREVERALTDALRSTAPERVLRAVSLLEQSGGSLRPHVAGLLAHAHERVVERGVLLATALDAKETVPQLEAIVRGSSDRRPRGEAIWALSKLMPQRALTVLPPLLESPDIGARCAAIAALLSIDGGYPPQLALEALLARGELAPAAERREVARLLGRLRDAGRASALARYFEDGDGSVRRIAIEAVGEGGYVSLAPRLLGFLTWREERRTAREALARLGDEVLPLVEQALNDRTRAAALRYELPRVLRQVGTARALAALLFSNIRDDAFLHYRIGVAISRLREERPELQVDTQRVREAIERRRDVYRSKVDAFRDLRAALGDEALLTRAVGDRLDQAFELSFWLLGLLYDAKSLRRVHQHLVGADPRRRAYALELLENMVASEDRALVSEQIEAHHRALPLGAAGRVDAHLAMLCHSDDNVLRACARHVARSRGTWNRAREDDDMSEAIVQRMFALEGVEIFGQSDVDDIAAVAGVAREQRFRQGERIYAEGDPGDALYVIIHGSVDARRQGEHVLTLKAKEAFGEISLLDGSPRPTEIVAAEDVTVLVIDRRDFLDLISDRPELLKGVFRAVSRQFKAVLAAG